MIYRFGDCELDTQLLELRRDDASQALDPLGFDLLRCLIENRDRVLTRAELLDTLWPGKVVSDSALSSRLKDVRSAVGDSGSAQRVVKTVHGRGYRFIADVDNSADARVPVAGDRARWLGGTRAIGRAAELGKLTRWLDRAAAGERTFIFVCGEAGIGKTTLTRTFLDAASERGDVLILLGQCINQRGGSEPYLPLLEALGRAGQEEPFIARLVLEQAPAWLTQMPSVLRGLDAAVDSPLGVTSSRMLRELSVCLDTLAHDHTVILVLEDLHWSDPSTVDWLQYHARRGDRSRLLVIATSRPEGDFRPALRELSLRGYGHELKLDAIDETDISDYLTNRLGLPPDPTLAAITFRRTAGFPLFIDTLVDHWLEAGLLRKDATRWSAAADEAALLGGVPENLAALIEQQLGNLGEDDRHLLETASLAGSPFAAAAVAHALGASAEDIESSLGRLARQGRVVGNAGETEWPDGTVTATFEFRHELYRAALYQQVAASRRVRLHRALGERLEKAYGDNPEPVAGEIADHFARAHEPARALGFFYPAARVAFNRSAIRETVAILDRALALTAAVDESPDRCRIERDLQLLRASALIALEGWSSPRVERAYLRAHELALTLGLKDNMAETYGLAAVHENRGCYQQSQAVVESLLGRATELGLEGHELLACSLFHQGRFDQSLVNAERAVEEFDPDEISAILARYGENPGVSCHNWAALNSLFMGHPEVALRRSDQALELASDHLTSRCSALTYRTVLHQVRGEPRETYVWFENTRELADRQGLDFRITQAMVPGEWARAKLSDDKDEQHAALTNIDAALQIYRDTQSVMDLPYQLTLKSDVLAHMGRVDEALAVQREAFAANPPGRAFFYEAEMHRHSAELIAKAGNGADGQVDQELVEARDIARRQGATLLELRACLDRCRLAGRPSPSQVDDLRSALAAIDDDAHLPEVDAARMFI